MSDITFTSLISDIKKYAFSPMDIRDVVFSALEKAVDGELDVVDPSNPFVYAISATAATVAGFMQEHEVRTRRLYPAVAGTIEDLYLHMSDRDYIDRFALPSKAVMRVVFQKTPLIEAMIDDPLTGNSVTVIPRNTLFKVAGVTFSMQYPIEIRQLAHGGMQITYLNDRPSPLRALGSNLVHWGEYTDTNKTQWVSIDIDVDQFFVDTVYNDISTSAGFVTDIPITDQYYYTRCWLQNQQGAWVEIKTTYTDKVYDPNTVTALVHVLEGKVRVTIPVVYTSTAIAAGKLRIDVYQTKGALTMQMVTYTSNEYSAKWHSIDVSEDTPLTIGVRQINNLLIFSESVVSGGRDALSFDVLKRRVIDNSVGNQILPITQAQLANSAIDLGYDIIKHVDTLTDRIFLATRELPLPTDTSILSPMTSTLLTTSIMMSLADDIYAAYDNGDTISLTQNVIYHCDNGVTKALTNADVSALMAMPISQRCKELSSGGYYYSPFTYILDATSEVFEVRAYSLDAPEILARNFVAENETLGYQVSISDTYSFEMVGADYVLTVKTSSSSAYKALPNDNVKAQLSIKSVNQANRVTVYGQLDSKDPSTGERVFKFTFGTNFNVDVQDAMGFPSIESTTNGLVVQLGLIQVVDILFLTTLTPDGYRVISSDSLTNTSTYSDDLYPAVISHEQFTLKFGDSLKSLWTQSRSAVVDIPVKVYTEDIPAYYEGDVYETDSSGVHFTTDADGKLVYHILHRKGDAILDSLDQPVYRHRRGEAIIDSYGQPVYMEGYKREMMRYVDISMLPAVYHFSTDPVITSYVSDVRTELVKWINEDIVKYQDYLLELTKIYFHPRVSSGIVEVIDGNNSQVHIPAHQSLTLKLYVSKSVYNDEVLKKKITDTSIGVINAALKDVVISVSGILSDLRQAYSVDVVDVELSGMGGDNVNGNVITILDRSARLSIGKKLVVRADNVLTVQEDVNVQFIQHTNV